MDRAPVAHVQAALTLADHADKNVVAADNHAAATTNTVVAVDVQNLCKKTSQKTGKKLQRLMVNTAQQ